nr:hypothetical protein GCM10020092_073210 [Actinoplanes digitatis]
MRQVSLADTGNWDTWAIKTDAVTLRAGGNTVAYRVDTGDVGHVNLDSLTVDNGTSAAPRTGTITGIGAKCIDVDNAGTADGTKIQLYTCNNSSAQSWTRSGDTLRALGKCLDVAGGGTANGTKVQLYTCNNGAAQVWQTQPNGSLLNPQSGKVLDAAGGASADGTQLQIWQWADVTQQRWAHNGTSRVTLFNGGNLQAFANADGTAPTWPVSGGSAEVLGGDLRTKQTYGDFRLHAEFWLPNLLSRRDRPGPGQQRHLPSGPLRDPGPRHVRKAGAGRQRMRRDLPETGALRQPRHRTGDLADLRHHVPGGPLRRRD